MGRSRTRAIALLAAALLLAGCSVDVDGAPCAGPGSTADCPAGQGCGNDLRCSARALACATTASRCTPGEGGACLDPEGLHSGVALARRCTDADRVCGSWVIEPCAANGFACGLRSGGARCECPANGRELTVRPDGSLAGALPYPSSAAAPTVCSYRRLSDALSAAAQIVADPTAVATVTAVGVAAGGTRTFSSATGETFPLVVRERVSLTSDGAAGGGSYELVFDAAGAASAAVELHSGGALADFTVRNGGAGATADAIALRCDGRSAPARLTGVVLDGRSAGGARLGHGFVVDGTCGVVAEDVHVRDMSVAAVAIDSPAAEVALTGGSIASSGDGVLLGDGRLLLDGVRVASNAGMGIRANDDFHGAPRVEVRRSKVVGNGDTGLAIVNAIEVRITGTTVFANGAARSWGGGSLVPSHVARKAGGLVLWGNPPVAGSLEFGRNRIYANAGDQVLALGTSSTSTWILDGAGCGSDGSGPDFNLLGCYDPTSVGTLEPYRGLVAIDANVSAKSVVWWVSMTPSLTTDFYKFGSGISVTTNPWCPEGDPTLVCTSEDPVP